MNLTELKRICSEAAPGPWSNMTNYGDGEEELGCCIYSPKPDGYYNMMIYDEGGHTVQDATFIATFNPVLVAKLLDVVDLLNRYGCWAPNEAQSEINEALAALEE